MDILIECTCCLKSFYRRKSDVNRSRKLNHLIFCSPECRKSWNNRFNGVIKCFNCDKEIIRKPNEVKRSKTKKFYCSHSCSASASNSNRKLDEQTKQKIKESLTNRAINNPKPRRFVPCVTCQKDFHQVKKINKFCSKECYRISKFKNEINQISSRTWNKIFKRAFPDWKCPYCNWSETFDVHHIIPRKDELNNNLDNLVLLCPNHHSLITRHFWNPNDLKKFSINNYYTFDELSQFYGKEQENEEFTNKFLQHC
jgi:protein-arginine kinase activator protein McsA